MQIRPISAGEEAVRMDRESASLKRWRRSRGIPCLLLFLCIGVLPTVSAAIVPESVPKFPCSVVENPGWPLEKLDLSFGTPLLEITDDGSHLVIGDIEKRKVFLLDRAGAVTELNASVSVKDVETAGYEVVLPDQWKRPGVPAPPSELIAISERDGVVHVLSQAYMPQPPGQKGSVIQSNSYRVLRRFDLEGNDKGVWVSTLRWTESPLKSSGAMAVDATGNVYVTGRDGVIATYDPEGKIIHRWKTLTEEAEEAWLNPEWVPPQYKTHAAELPPGFLERMREEERSRQTQFKEDLARMEEAGEVTFKYVRTEIMPGMPKGIEVDQEGNLYVSGPGLDGVLEIRPNGTSRYFPFPDTIAREGVFVQSGDLALHDGKLFVTADQKGVFVFTVDGKFLGHVPTFRGREFGTSIQVAVPDNGNIYVADRTWFPPEKYWLEVFVPE